MNTEMCDFVKLVLDRMDTNPEEFIDGDPKHRWGAMSRGIIDWVMGNTDSTSARSLWALEPHEREALTTKYKAIYLEREKRAFLKNILSGDETKPKRVNVVPRSATPLTSADISRQALQIMEDEWGKAWSNTTIGQNSLLGANTLPVGNGGILSGYTDARALYGTNNLNPQQTLAEAVRNQIDNTNND